LVLFGSLTIGKRGGGKLRIDMVGELRRKRGVNSSRQRTKVAKKWNDSYTGSNKGKRDATETSKGLIKGVE